METIIARVLESIVNALPQPLCDRIMSMLAAHVAKVRSIELSGNPLNFFWLHHSNEYQRMQSMQSHIHADLCAVFGKQKTPKFDGIVLFDSYEKVYDNEQWTLNVFDDKETPPSLANLVKMQHLLEHMFDKTGQNVLFVFHDNAALHMPEATDVYAFCQNFPMQPTFWILWLYGNENGTEHFEIMSRL